MKVIFLFALSLFYSNSYLSAYANNFYYLILMSVMYFLSYRLPWMVR